MAINQVQLRLSIDGQQALSTIDALSVKQAELVQSTKAMTDARTQDMNELKNGLVEIYKLQEKQAILDKQMAAASASGNAPLLSKLETQYEGNADKINELLTVQRDYNEAIHQNDLAIAKNNTLIRENNKELEKLYLSEGKVLIQEAKLVAEKRALTREASLAGNGSERQAKAENRLAEVNKELTNRIRDRAKATVAATQKIIEEQGIEKVSTDDLITLNKALETANKHRTDRTTEEAKQEIASIKEVNKELAKRKEETAPEAEGFSLGGMMKSLKGGLGSAVIGGAAGALAGGLFSVVAGAFEKIGEVISATIDHIAQKATEITAIQTSLDITRIKAGEINRSLNDIDTKTSVSELNKLVEVAGSLNVPLEEVKQFVKEADKSGVVLGKAFGGAEEAVTQIAKLKGEFRDTKDLRIDESLSKIGSVLKALDLAGPASVEGITDFLKRAGNIPDAIKPSITQLAAFAAVFEEANLSSEISASSFGKILQEGANNLDLFGKQMGVSANYVKVLINQDPNAFILKFSESLKGLNGTQLAQTLKALHLEGSETFKTIGVLTDNVEKFREKQNLTNNEFERDNTINRIFNDINSDEAAKIEKISKSWEKLKSSLTSWAALLVGPIITSLASASKKTEDLTESFKKQSDRAKNLETTATSLLQRYIDLSEAAKTGAKNQNELNKTIANIGKVVPEAVTATDAFGNAIRFNLGLVELAIEKNKQLAESMKLQARGSLNFKNNTLGVERAEIVKKLNEYTDLEARLSDAEKRNLSGYEIGHLTVKRDKLKTQIAGLHQRADEINAEIASNKKLNKDLDVEQNVATDTKPPKTGSTYQNLDIASGKGDKAENARILKEKYEQTQRDNMVELQAKLAFEELQATADAEQKRINIANNTAENELKRIQEQFKNQKGIILKESQLNHEQKALIHRERLLIEKKQEEEVVAIDEEFSKKREAQIIEQTNRAIAITQEARKNELDSQLKKATTQGGSLGIFNSKSNIVNFNEVKDQANLDIKYAHERETLKDNTEALKILEENYQKEKNAITVKYVAERDQLIFDADEKELDRVKKTNLEKLKLDVEEAKNKGKNPIKQEFALVNAQMAIELSAKDLTEAEKTNIVRKYALQRASIEDESHKKGVEKAIGYFQQAFSTISSIFSASLQNRTVEEQNTYDNSIKKLDDQKDHSVITNRQYLKQKQVADKEHDKEQRKLKREQFELDKAANIANIIMKTALAVINTAATAGPWAIPATIVLGAVELGIALSQVSPYAEGGKVQNVNQNLPMKKPSSSAILSWLNEDGQEYVVPNWQLNDPVAANLVDVLEHRRQNKIVGHAQGGFASENNTNFKVPAPMQSLSTDEFMKICQMFGNYVNEFGSHVSNPMPAPVFIGEKETYEMELQRTKLKKKLDNSYANTNQSLIE